MTTKIKTIATTFAIFLIASSFIYLGTSFGAVASRSANSESQATIMPSIQKPIYPENEVPASPFHPTGLLPTKNSGQLAQVAQHTDQPQFHPTNSEAANPAGETSQTLELTDPISGYTSVQVGDTVTITAEAKNYNGYMISQWGTPGLLSFVSHSADYVTDDDDVISTTYRVVAAGSAQLYLKVKKDNQIVNQVAANINCGPGGSSQTLELTDPIGGSTSAQVGDTVSITARATNYNGYKVSQWGTPGLLTYVSHSADYVTSDDQEISTTYRVVAAGSAQLKLSVVKDNQVVKQVAANINCGGDQPVNGNYQINVHYGFLPPLQYITPMGIAIYLLDDHGNEKKISQTGIIPDISKGYCEGIALININDVPQGTFAVAAGGCAPYGIGSIKIYGQTTVTFDGKPGLKGSISMGPTSLSC
ncbi:MAG: hypothetical protein ABR985_21955 [Methanotrichaceae archaeon]